QSSHDWIGGCICSDVTHREVQPRFAHQLCRYSFAYAGRTPQAEGFSQRVWRLRRKRAGVTLTPCGEEAHQCAQSIVALAGQRQEPLAAPDEGPVEVQVAGGGLRGERHFLHELLQRVGIEIARPVDEPAWDREPE